LYCASSEAAGRKGSQITPDKAFARELEIQNISHAHTILMSDGLRHFVDAYQDWYQQGRPVFITYVWTLRTRDDYLALRYAGQPEARTRHAFQRVKKLWLIFRRSAQLGASWPTCTLVRASRPNL
jgi:hypothetical protein